MADDAEALWSGDGERASNEEIAKAFNMPLEDVARLVEWSNEGKRVFDLLVANRGGNMIEGANLFMMFLGRMGHRASLYSAMDNPELQPHEHTLFSMMEVDQAVKGMGGEGGRHDGEELGIFYTLGTLFALFKSVEVMARLGAESKVKEGAEEDKRVSPTPPEDRSWLEKDAPPKQPPPPPKDDDWHRPSGW